MAGELPKTSDIDLNRTLADRYRIVRLVGSGGMGSVFVADDLRLGRACAVKVLREDMATRPKARRRFDREASLLGRLVHENIVALLDVGVTGAGQPFLVLEYLRGRTLRSEFQEAGVRPLERTLEIVGQVARGLAYAHSAGVIHRDLKPENIMLTEHADGRLLVKLLDFGIARLRDGSGETITATDAGIGTAAYMAPEQARGEEALDAATDVYALGAIVYEALAGRRPYDGGSYNETLFQILNHRHKPLAEVCPHLPLAVSSAVERALEKSSKARFATVHEFVTALGVEQGVADADRNIDLVFGSSETTAVSEDEGGRRATPGPARYRSAWRLVASGAAGLVLGTLSMGWWFASRSGAEATAAARSSHPELSALPSATQRLLPAEPLVSSEPSRRAPASTPVRAESTLIARPAGVSPTAPSGRPGRGDRPAPRVTVAPSPPEPSNSPPADGPPAVPRARASFPPTEGMPSGYIAESPYASGTGKREP